MNGIKTEDILMEDDAILVIHKHAGIAVQHFGSGVMDLEHQLLNYLAGKGSRRIPYLGVIHRLDQPVEGILVFAKTREAAKRLNQQMQCSKMKKEYVAVVEQAEGEQEGELTDYLWRDGKKNISMVMTAGSPGAKRAELSYRVLKRQPDTGRAVVRIILKTGRHHQIRVQMSHADMPLCGDRKYNSVCREDENLALCADSLSFEHPLSGKKLEFHVQPENPLFGKCHDGENLS